MPSLTGDRSEPRGWLPNNRDGNNSGFLWPQKETITQPVSVGDFFFFLNTQELDKLLYTLDLSFLVTLDQRKLTHPFWGILVTLMRIPPPPPGDQKSYKFNLKKLSKLSFYYRRLVKNEGFIFDSGREVCCLWLLFLWSRHTIFICPSKEL